MSAKQHSSGKRKSGEISRSERTSANQQAESILNDIKEKAGEVVLVQITDRTSIELPASLSIEEREARVANYLKLHKSKI